MLRVLFLLFISVLTFGCISERSNKPLIVTSLPVWESVAEYIGGRDFDYYSILRGGESPHGYEPKPSDIEKERRASLVIVHGLGLDDWALKGVRDKRKVLNLGELFSKKYPQVKEPGYHLWMNPVLMEDVYFEVAERLVKFYPKRETYYKKRAEDYAAMIDQLISRIDNCLKDRKENVVVIYHPVWKSLLKTFGIKVIEIARAPEEQVTPGRLKEVIEEAKREGARVVISEVFSNQKIPKLVAREINGKLLILNPVPEENYVKALSAWGEEICRALKE